MRILPLFLMCLISFGYCASQELMKPDEMAQRFSYFGRQSLEVIRSEEFGKLVKEIESIKEPERAKVFARVNLILENAVPESYTFDPSVHAPESRPTFALDEVHWAWIRVAFALTAQEDTETTAILNKRILDRQYKEARSFLKSLIL